MNYLNIDNYLDYLVEHTTPECTAWNIEKIRTGAKGSWNYIDGCMLYALLETAELNGKHHYHGIVDQIADHYIDDSGSIRGFKCQDHNLDDINEGRILFPLYHLTGNEKYRRGADFLFRQLQEQPRTTEGNFWHKQIYPNQVWLDGIYMAQPFLAQYTVDFGDGDCSDTIHQIENVTARMRDDKTGLYYHGYDASRQAFWADPITGCSRNFWLRALGWFSVALVDLLDIIPRSQSGSIYNIFVRLMDAVSAYSDEETGLYWQVMNFPGREGNYLETSGSCMIAYAMLKGARLGLLDKEYAAKGEKTFNGIMNRYYSFNGDTPNLGGICLVAGLGPETNRRRDGTYEYYISEPVVSNDAKGVAPFILCYTEILRLQ